MQIIEETIRERRANCEPNLVGLAGEHLACAFLCRLGLSTIFYPYGTKKVDLSATNIENLKKMDFQVKTLRNGHQFFLNSGKIKPKDNFYIIFIVFYDDPNKIPDFYIIPSKQVLTEGKWDATIPRFNLNKEKHEIYKNNWSPVVDYIFN